MTPPASAAAASPAPRVAPPRPRSTPKRQRRVSGPARPAPARPRIRTEPQQAPREGFVVGLLGFARALSSHRLLDRLIRGRMWIGIVAFALIGIVTLQLGLLKLNSGIGRSLEREAYLQRANAALSIENSELASGTRVEAQAERLGMRISAVSSLHFLSARSGGAAARAAEVLRKPLSPASEPPGGSEGSASGSEETAAAASSEPAASGETSTQESATAAKSGGEEAAAPPQESASQAPAGESSTAPASGSTPSSTGATAPAVSEGHTEAGGGTEAPGG